MVVFALLPILGPLQNTVSLLPPSRELISNCQCKVKVHALEYQRHFWHLEN